MTAAVGRAPNPFPGPGALGSLGSVLEQILNSWSWVTAGKLNPAFRRGREKLCVKGGPAVGGVVLGLALWMQESRSVQCPHLLTPFELVLLPPLLQSSPALQPPVNHSLFMLFLSGCSAPQVVGMSPDLIKSSKPPVVSLFTFHKVKRHLGCAGGQRASPRAESRTDPPQVGGWWEVDQSFSRGGLCEQAGTCLTHGPGWPLLHGQISL